MRISASKTSLLLLVAAVLLCVKPTFAFAAPDFTFDENSLVLLAIAFSVFLVTLNIIVLSKVLRKEKKDE
ncbi:MAG: hypothetical protein FWE41_07595 [Coriobacteriia bacterium]|nr:hypothetical protein [Coriobacteriia bacterium]